ncbi:MAG: ISAs1 family transposase [Desulfosporosinus sp.]|nr:ISAs1 family transposase [Desulfosporosinus sp.]
MSTEKKEKKTLIESFEGLVDPRNHDDILHKLIDIIAITILAMMCGANGWNEIELFGKSKESWLRTFLELPNGIPSHDTFNRVFSRLDPKEFHQCFMEWVSLLYEKVSREIVALDGKTVRRSKGTSKNQKPIHVVSAWANTNKLVLGQLNVNEKSNEITAIPELLKMLDINGCIITIDAMGTQTEIAKTIIESGTDYVLALKENQNTLHDDVELYFNEEVLKKGKKELVKEDIYHITLEKDHGRIEKREYYMVKDVSWLEQLNRWPNLSAIGMAVFERQEQDKTSVETRLYSMSKIKNVVEFSTAVRGHWGIENELHWCLDMGFREDESRARKDHAAENLNIIRHMTMNMFKKETSLKAGIAGKRLKCGWDENYLKKVLSTGFQI